jgi:hypothetical protein
MSQAGIYQRFADTFASAGDGHYFVVEKIFHVKIMSKNSSILLLLVRNYHVYQCIGEKLSVNNLRQPVFALFLHSI